MVLTSVDVIDTVNLKNTDTATRPDPGVESCITRERLPRNSKSVAFFVTPMSLCTCPCLGKPTLASNEPTGSFPSFLAIA